MLAHTGAALLDTDPRVASPGGGAAAAERVDAGAIATVTRSGRAHVNTAYFAWGATYSG